jgi:ECF sigma factor
MSDSASPSNGVTQLLVSWSEGDPKAAEALTPLAYDELRRLAPVVTCAGNVRITHFKARRWFTKLICEWLTRSRCAGKPARISLEWPHKLFAAYLRGAPLGLPFFWSEETLWAGLNFTLTTSLVSLDLPG